MTRSPLQDEVKKRNPFDAPEQEVALNLVKTSEFLQAAFSRLFKQHQITGAQYNVLRILRGAGTSLPSQEIAGRMITHLPDVTRLVDRLEASGLVARCRIPEDRRVVLVAVTEAGLDLLAKLDAPVLALHRTQLGHLTAAEMAEFNRLLVKARRPAAPECGPPAADTLATTTGTEPASATTSGESGAR